MSLHILNQKPSDPKSFQNLKGKRFWLDLVDPPEEVLKLLQKAFKLHPLVIENIQSARTRPKVESFEQYEFIVGYGFERLHELRLQEVDFILGKNFLISSHKKPIASFEDLKKDNHALNEQLKRGPDFFLYVLFDQLIDGMFPVLDSIDEELENHSKNALTQHTAEPISNLLKLRRELFHAKRIAGPQRDLIIHLAKGYRFIGEESGLHFRDCYDHMIRANDIIENLREIIASTVEIHLSVVSNRMNEVMKVLTIIATLMLPLSVIAGVYGMNFKNMPELYWRYGYFMVLGAMALVAGSMLLFFKKKKWF